MKINKINFAAKHKILFLFANLLDTIVVTLTLGNYSTDFGLEAVKKGVRYKFNKQQKTK